MSHSLLIYHEDCRTFGEILSKRLPQLEIHTASRPVEAWDVIDQTEIILSWKIPEELLKRAKKLVWFASTAAGNENLVKSPYLAETVTLTKTTIYGETMVEYVFAYLLYFCRNLPDHFKDQPNRVWNRLRPGRLRGKTMGILGLGSVGKEIAKRGKQFGMNILGMRRIPGPVENVDQVFGPGELGKMIPRVDDLVVVLPLTPETYHLLGEKELSLMKEGTILINIGRGRTIDEQRLIRVLKANRIRAVLDVFEEEPLPAESELWNLENVIITPHISGMDLPEEICEEFIANYKKWIVGKPLAGLVDRNRGY